MSTPADQIPDTQNPEEPKVTQDQNTNPNPQTGVINPPGPDRFSMLEDIIRQQNDRIAQIIEAQTRPAPTPPPDPEKQKAEFFNNPHNTVQEIVRKELKEAIAPLQDFVSNLSSETAYNKIKQQVRAEFGNVWDNAVENAVDQVMLSGKVAVTVDNVRATTVQAIGLKSLGRLPGSNVQQPPAPQNNQDNNNMITPPHLRPSNPPSPQNNNNKPKRALTENERRIARENRMTDEEYLSWLEVPDTEVVSSKIGRKS